MPTIKPNITSDLCQLGAEPPFPEAAPAAPNGAPVDKRGHEAPRLPPLKRLSPNQTEIRWLRWTGVYGFQLRCFGILAATVFGCWLRCFWMLAPNFQLNVMIWSDLAENKLP